MKNQLLIHAAFAALILGTGCNKQSNPTAENPATNDNSSQQYAKEIATNAWQKTKEMTTNTLADVKEGTATAWANTKKASAEAWSDVKESLGSATDYTYDKKDEFVTKARADLDALDQKIKELSDKTASASDSVKADAQTKIQTLRDKRTALDKKLDDVKNSAEANWNDVKTAFKDSYDDAKNSLKEAWQWLNEKLTS